MLCVCESCSAYVSHALRMCFLCWFVHVVLGAVFPSSCVMRCVLRCLLRVLTFVNRHYPSLRRLSDCHVHTLESGLPVSFHKVCYRVYIACSKRSYNTPPLIYLIKININSRYQMYAYLNISYSIVYKLDTNEFNPTPYYTHIRCSLLTLPLTTPTSDVYY